MTITALVQGDAVTGRLVIANNRFSGRKRFDVMCLIGIALWCAALSLSQHTFMQIVAFGCVGVILCHYSNGSRGALIGLIRDP